MRYFLHLAYEGSNYSGWQRQKNTANTIQEIIEQNLKQIFKKEIVLYGCGRTDAGVHASQYVAHINLEQAPTFDLKFRLNKNLPDDIAVFEVIEVQENQHCRYDADLRSYDYFIHWHKDPALMRYSLFFPDKKLDFDKMKRAVELIRNTQDFKNLCKQPDVYDNTICYISNAELFIDEERGRLRFTVSSNRFLRGMVRLCVFFLLQVGTGKMSLELFEQILKQEKDLKEKQPALPNGLFLSKVNYPFLVLENKHQLITMLKMGLQ